MLVSFDLTGAVLINLKLSRNSGIASGVTFLHCSGYGLLKIVSASLKIVSASRHRLFECTDNNL